MIYYMYNHKAEESTHKIPATAIEGEKIKHFYPLIHYCEHCHTDIVGVWEFYGGNSKYYEGCTSDYVPSEKKDFIQYGFLTGQFFDSRQKCNEFIYEKIKMDQAKWDYQKEERRRYAEKTLGLLTSLLPVFPIIKKYRNEYLSFASMERCPICGEKFSNDFRHHLATVEPGTDMRTWNKDKGKGKFDNDLAIMNGKWIFTETYSWNMCRFSASKTDGKWNETTSLFEGRARTGSNTSVYGTNIKMPSYDKSWRSKVRYDESSIESLLAFFRALRDEEREEYSNNKQESNIVRYDVSVPAKQDKTNIKADVDALKIYLSNLIDLEKHIYSVSERLKELYQIEFDADGEAIASEYLLIKEKPTPDSLLEEYERLVAIGPKITDISDFMLKRTLSRPVMSRALPLEPTKPILGAPGIFNKKKVMAQNEALMSEYQQKYRTYETEKSEYEQELSEYKEALELYNQEEKILLKKRDEEYTAACEKAKQEHAEKCEEAKELYEKALREYDAFKLTAKDIVTPEKAKQSLIKKEITQAEELLAKLYAARNEMYAYDIVFGKYRDIVALSTFYEYLMAGRCETLEGTAGAYNLYETEIRMNTVISKLSDVITSLEEIKNTQYMIYSAINSANQQLRSLNMSMRNAVNSLEKIEANTTNMDKYLSEISDNTKVIAYNTEATAFYAKKNAELTNALGYMVALG